MGHGMGALSVALLGCLLCISQAAAASSAVSSDPRVVELMAKEAESAHNVIQMSDEDFDKYVVPSAKRGYSVIVFMTANHLLDKPTIQLRQLRSEYYLAAESYYAEHHGTKAKTKLFFAEFEFAENQEVFQRVSVQSLPFVWRSAPALKARGKAGMVTVAPEDQMTQDLFDHYPWIAEDFVAWIADRTGLGATVARPSILESPIVWAFLLLMLYAGLYVAYKILVDGWFSDPMYSIVGCLLVTWFATSGGMYNIIRGVPLTSWSHDTGKATWYTGGQGQLGAEGYVAGTMCMLISLSMVAISFWAPKIRSKFKQRVVTYTAVAVMYLMFVQIWNFYIVKTGYTPEYFLF